MKSLRALSLSAALLAGVAADTMADVRATALMRSGERVSGNLEAMDGGVLFLRATQNDQRKLPFDQVALIDFVGGADGLPETELREARGSEHLLLERSGNATKGRLLDIEGGRGTSEGTASKLTFIFRTSAGEERRLESDQIARIYLGNFPGTATSTVTEPDQPTIAGAVRVAATQRWVDTGIVVTKDQRVRFNTTGQVRLSQDGQDVAMAAGSKQGRRAPNAPLPDALAGALIGRVGNSEAFGIGDQQGPLTMPASGRLFLGINDDELGDNDGSFQVTVTPEPSTSSSRRRRS